jgi:hypothetical protein
VVAFEEEEHDDHLSGSGSGEGSISGAVKLKDLSSVSDVLQFEPTQDEMAAVDAQDDFESFAEQTQHDDLVAKDAQQEDKGSMIDEF